MYLMLVVLCVLVWISDSHMRWVDSDNLFLLCQSMFTVSEIS